MSDVPVEKETNKGRSKPVRFVLAALLFAGGMYVLLYGIDGGGFMESEWEREYRLEQQAERDAFSKVSVTAGYDVVDCNTEFPVKVEISNRSSVTIESTSIDMNVRRDGFSSTINENTIVYSDRIIEPGKTYRFCNKLVLAPNFTRYYETPEELIFDMEVSMLNTDIGYINRPYRD